MIASFFILIFLITISRKYKTSSFVYIYSMWYLIILFDYLLVQNTFVPFSSLFDPFFVYFSLMFVFLYLLIDGVLVYSGKIRFKKISFYSYNFFLLFSLFLAFMSILVFIKTFVSMPFLLVRSMIASKEISFHIGVSFPFVSACLFYQNIKNISKYKKFLTVILFFLALISSSKQFIVLAFLYSVPWYTGKFRLKLFPVLLVVMTGFLLFLLLHVVTERVVGTGNLVQKTMYTINGYLLGGIAVFQLFLDGRMQQHITVDSWVKTGDWIGNVYSGFYNFYKERSIALLTVRIFCIALLYAFFNSKRKSAFSKFIRVYSVFPLLFFIFSDLYMPSIKQWLMFIFAGIGISLLTSDRSYISCKSVHL